MSFWGKLRRFFKSLSFVKALIIATAMVIPVVVSYYVFEVTSYGFSVGLGALFAMPSDVSGSLKHKFYGILTSIVISFLATFLIGKYYLNVTVLVPVFTILVFFISYLAIYGFRASLISLSGLLAVSLGFAYESTEMPILIHAILVAFGGFWYLGLTMLVSFLFPKIQTDQLFVEVIENTARFIEIRGRMLVEVENRKELYHEFLQLQTAINDGHEEIREVILSKRVKSGFSNRTRRQQLIFSKLIEIYEYAVSNPVEYEKFDVFFGKYKSCITAFKQLNFQISNQLNHISRVILKVDKLQFDKNIFNQLNTVETEILRYRDEVGLPESREGTVLLYNLRAYQEKQYQNLTDIERVLGNYTKNDQIKAIEDAERFITPQDYDSKKFKANLSFKSPIFRHSLRLTLTMVTGLLIGDLIEMQNSYWILLTLVVIMRPSYGLTKQRSMHRVVGTLIGAALGTIVVILTQNPIAYAVLAVVSLILGFSLVKSNYRNAAVFITLYVIFMYALIHPNILDVIKFRVLDTFTGAALAALANVVLWPSWEVKSINEIFTKSIRSELVFLREIQLLYHKKGIASTEYRLARKEAFLQVGNLNAAYQRLVQEPKSKQQNFGEIYELVTVLNTFLSSLSSLGMFIRTNETSHAPKEFDTFITYISANLNTAIELLESNNTTKYLPNFEVRKAGKSYDKSFQELSALRDKEIAQGKPISKEMQQQLRETQMVAEQVKWLYNLSESVLRVIQFTFSPAT